jgi:integrase
MAKIEKLPSGNFRVRAYDKSTKKTKSFTASTKAEVKRMAAEWLYLTDHNVSGEIAVKEAIDRYIKNRSSVLSPSTLRCYLQFQRTYYSDIEYYTVSGITSEDIQRFVNRLASGLAPKTVKNIYGLLVSSLTAIDPNKAINVTMPQKKVIERHIPTDEDIKNILSMVEGPFRIAILLAAVGTLRRGEISALRYEDINGNVIHVHSDMVAGPDGFVIKDIPKTSSSDRYIELPQKIIDEIGTGEGFVVPLAPSSITNRFQRVKKALGLNCRFHDLRHYAASVMHAIGVPDQYIMERGGWSSDVILKSVYRNVLDDKKKEFTDMTNSYAEKFF